MKRIKIIECPICDEPYPENNGGCPICNSNNHKITKTIKVIVISEKDRDSGTNVYGTPPKAPKPRKQGKPVEIKLSENTSDMLSLILTLERIHDLVNNELHENASTMDTRLFTLLEIEKILEEEVDCRC